MFKNSRGLIVGLVALVALTGCATTDHQATITDQAAQIASLTADNAAITSRLNVCLESAERYRGYVEENKVLMQGIIDKWGINYNAPVRNAMTALDNAAAQLDCS